MTLQSTTVDTLTSDKTTNNNVLGTSNSSTSADVIAGLNTLASLGQGNINLFSNISSSSSDNLNALAAAGGTAASLPC